MRVYRFVTKSNIGDMLKGFRISTYGFGLEGNKLLRQCLEENFSISSNLLCDEKGYQLLIPKKSASRLYELVGPYIVNCMRYKFASLTP